MKEKMSFNNFNLTENIQKVLASEGYSVPTPIQEMAIPVILEGKDLIGCAQTGTGKTAAFALPVLKILDGEKLPRKFRRNIKALVLTPTRELAQQISDSFNKYGSNSGIRNTVVYGGVPQRPQTEKLKKGVDILIATPGRLLDLMQQRYISLDNVKILILDEADRMLDMGFIVDIKRIIEAVPKERQTLFFSATMPPEVLKLTKDILKDPVKISVTPETPAVELIKQELYYVSRSDKKNLLLHLLKDDNVSSALVFTRTKHAAENISKYLNTLKINADAIHGDKSQNARQRALDKFKAKKTRVLVATDIASRGIDVQKLSHVINFDIPEESETYIHRIGRTGRAGLGGVAVTFCDSEERSYLRDINRLIKIPIPVVHEHPFASKIDEIKDVTMSGFRKEKSSRFSQRRKGSRPWSNRSGQKRKYAS
jgi:ATP-dependent RNA helicase RhlE